MVEKWHKFYCKLFLAVYIEVLEGVLVFWFFDGGDSDFGDDVESGDDGKIEL